MIAVDSSTWVAYFEGAAGEDVEMLDRLLADRVVVLPAPALAELLSAPARSADLADLLLAVPLLEPTEGFWARAGALRAKALLAKQRARIADALIAQLCVDSGVPLVTRDRDFRAFTAAAGLDLALP
jgi:predicted nucleic acid-binding protein